MYPISGTIKFDSNSNAISNNISNLSMRFTTPIKIPQDKKSYLKIKHCKIPMIKYNISSSLSNNTIRYSVDSGSNYTEIDFGSGIFEVGDIYSYIRQELFNNEDYETNDNGENIVPFSVQGNSSTSKGFILINPNWSDVTQIIVDLSNNTTSLFYELLGFTSILCTLDGSSKIIQESTNNIDIYDSQFYILITNGIIESYTQGYLENTILYMGNLDGPKNGIKNIQSSDEIIQPILDGIENIARIDIQFVDRNNSLIVFGPDTSTDSNLTIELELLTHIK
jgi:hypothetical protein